MRVSPSGQSLPLDIASLRRGYRDSSIRCVDVAETVVAGIAADATAGIWTALRPSDEVVAEARSLERAYPPGSRPPLYGLPFAVKDNIDVGGVTTTAACPEFAYLPGDSAPVVDRIRAAGALYVGKTNLDQLATGLVGVRSPYGIPPNPFDPRYVSGGSSSGSAAAVARGLVSFALATDTAGSGRVPAALNHIVGLKPSRGLLSTRGVVPACRSMDCVTILALTCEDATEVAAVATAFDPRDPYSRPEASRFRWRADVSGRRWRVGIPRPEDQSFDDEQAREGFAAARATLEQMGAAFENVDMTPFFEAGRLLYQGPWIAERLSGFDEFIHTHPEALLPVIRTILNQGAGFRAVDAFRGLHTLAALRRAVEPLWTTLDALVLPSVPGTPRIDEVLADPIAVNTRLGLYTTFANLLDLAAVAVPSGIRPDGLPAGVTFVGPWGRDPVLAALASAFHRRSGGPLGATGWPWPAPAERVEEPLEGRLLLAVVGAHLSGMPLNHQLTERGAHCVRATRTAPSYRLYALPGTHPPKPGLVRVTDSHGTKIDLEVWALPRESVGSFLEGVGAPLAIGTIDLEDGGKVHGFLCEAHAVASATDISSFGGWRAYATRQG
ncbi:MAG: allophanate hydrolase [Polyangiaceae bacterium]